MSLKDYPTNLDIETRFELCRTRETFKTTKGESFEYFVNNLATGFFTKPDLDTPEFQKLIANYGNQLLVPLFQDSPLYSRVNTKSDGKPKYNQAATFSEVAKYSGIDSDYIDPCFYLLDSTDAPRFERLIGYTLGFGLQKDTGILELIKGKLWSNEDDIELPIPLSEIDNLAGKTTYFSGIGVAEEFQSKGGLGLILMYKLLEHYQDLGYNSTLTRVKRGAKNFTLFAGLGNHRENAIPSTIDVVWYTNDIEGEKYRGVFLNNISQTQQYIKQILSNKGSGLPSKI